MQRKLRIRYLEWRTDDLSACTLALLYGLASTTVRSNFLQFQSHYRAGHVDVELLQRYLFRFGTLAAHMRLLMDTFSADVAIAFGGHGDNLPVHKQSSCDDIMVVLWLFGVW